MASLLSSELTLSMSLSRSVSESSPAVSSANRKVIRAVIAGRSFIKQRKSMGPSICTALEDRDVYGFRRGEMPLNVYTLDSVC